MKVCLAIDLGFVVRYTSILSTHPYKLKGFLISPRKMFTLPLANEQRKWSDAFFGSPAQTTDNSIKLPLTHGLRNEM
jgi:hypothetical protein